MQPIPAMLFQTATRLAQGNAAIVIQAFARGRLGRKRARGEWAPSAVERDVWHPSFFITMTCSAKPEWERMEEVD